MTEFILLIAAALVVMAIVVRMKGRQQRKHPPAHGLNASAPGSLPRSDEGPLKERHAVDVRDETGRTGLARDPREDVLYVEDLIDENDDEAVRLRALRRLQRAEKIREAAEDELLAASAPDAPLVLSPEDERNHALREFQRAEKIREAAEEELAQGPVVEIDPPIEKRIAQNVVELRREEAKFEPKKDVAYASMMAARAEDLILDFNAQFGWAPGEGSVADRLFNTDVEKITGRARSTGVVDFQLERVVQVLSWYARAQTGGRSEIAEVMATRVLLGSGRLTGDELTELDMQRRLFGDDFADAVGFTNRISQAQERNVEKRLGLQKDRAPERDQLRRSGPTLSR